MSMDDIKASKAEALGRLEVLLDCSKVTLIETERQLLSRAQRGLHELDVRQEPSTSTLMGHFLTFLREYLRMHERFGPESANGVRYEVENPTYHPGEALEYVEALEAMSEIGREDEERNDTAQPAASRGSSSG